jgi:hypothetical protein
MSAAGNVRQTERVLKRSAKAALADGNVLIFGDFDGTDIRGNLGVCVLGAHNSYCRGERLSLPDDSDAMAEAWDSIEMGWDGVAHKKARTQTGRRVVKRWWSMGYRLRKAMKPTRAAT